MKCMACKSGETHSGCTTVTITRGERAIVVQNVPAELCDICDEFYLGHATSERILNMAEEAIEQNHEVKVIQFTPH